MLYLAAVLCPIILGVYTYALYPALLWLIGALRAERGLPSENADLPSISIIVIAYNEARSIASTLEALLAVDYPIERRAQVLVVSDSSTDGTDDIVHGFAARGVELIRTPYRLGKTAAENFSLDSLRGEVVINTDAAVRLHPGAVRLLVEALGDPDVGLASGTDISVSSALDESNGGEGQYVGYEMWTRKLETRAGGIIGASGCLFAIRRLLHLESVPIDCLRDFAAPLMVKTLGYRAVAVPSAICYVPRTALLRSEYRRKVRTFALGIGTLRWQRQHLNPVRDPLFAWKLFSHKVCRWMLPWTVIPAIFALAWAGNASIRVGLAVSLFILGAAMILAASWPLRRPQPRLLAFMAITIATSVASLQATTRAFRRAPTHLWEPTRRRPVWGLRSDVIPTGAGQTSS
jgi:cellulose synthase/poly-beta-1,6-N-acetylglucosamine synthase-like glycosyltransferase